ADRNRSHWSTSKTPSYTKSVSWQHHPLSDIAIQLNRNIKTIRAHKFNAMTKLGVRSDIGLLNAADILLHLPLNSTTSAVKQVA
ncbi:bgl operon transcriptional regulator BglJ, partial [Klebsiella pneumoniae]